MSAITTRSISAASLALAMSAALSLASQPAHVFAAWALMGLGLMAVGAVARRRRG